MTRKYLIKAAVAVVASVFVSFLLQTSFFSKIDIAGITPNLMLIVAAMFGFMLGGKFGMAAGFICGLLLDLFNGTNFGMYSLIYTYIGLLNGLFSTIFYGDDIKLPLFLVGASDIIFGIVLYGMFFFLNGDTDFVFYLMNVIIPEAVYTVVVSLAYYYPFKNLTAWVDKEEKRGTRIIA